MDMSRRLVLGGMFGVAVAAGAGPVTASVSIVPTLWGDGIHDDAPALNAIVQGQRVKNRCAQAIIHPDGELSIIGANLLLRDQWFVPAGSKILVASCKIMCAPDFPEDRAMIWIEADVSGEICNNLFIEKTALYGVLPPAVPLEPEIRRLA